MRGFRLLPLLLLLTALPGNAQERRPPLYLPAQLSRLSPHVWMVKGFPNIGFVVGANATLVIDTSMGTKNGKLVAETAAKLSPPGHKLYITTTHYHTEHTSGDGGFPAGTVTIRAKVQEDEMKADGPAMMEDFRGRSAAHKELLADARIRPADIVFDRDYRLDLGGGVIVRMYWFGMAHTKGDQMVMVEPDSVLFTGDVVQNKAGPSLYCNICNLRSWIAVVDRIALLAPKIVVPDHSDVGGAELIAQERNMLADLQASIVAQKNEGKAEDQAIALLQDEFAARYFGWTSLNHTEDIVRKTYADGGAR